MLSAALLVACTGPPTRVKAPPGSLEPTPPIAHDEPVAAPPCTRIVRIEVWKQERTLRAYCKRGAVIEMAIALGRQEVGPKTQSGDQRTPEGRYQIAGKARTGRFHLFLPIDYPSTEDAEVALGEGRLSAADHHRIIAAHEAGLLPPDDTPLGGDLGFHGEGERWKGSSRHLDWTYGCIAVTDEEIEFLSERAESGVPVWIHP
jgi:murein L,D-transpeptidase YafK